MAFSAGDFDFSSLCRLVQPRRHGDIARDRNSCTLSVVSVLHLLAVASILLAALCRFAEL